jgi:amyloid beta precursor protein binding protein 1
LSFLFDRIVVESHPDNAVDDLRLLAPFPALVDHMNSYGDLSLMPAKKVCHVPYPVVIYKYLSVYRKNRPDGSPPGTRAEKLEFQAMLRRGKSEAAKRAAREQAEQEREHENGHGGDQIEVDVPGQHLP